MSNWNTHLKEIIKESIQEQMGDWHKSTYDKTKFKMNPRRISDMTGLVDMYKSMIGDARHDKDAGLEHVWSEDLKDIKYIFQLLMLGRIDSAIHAYDRLDTAVRDEFPQWMMELSGATINPSFYKQEDSLEGTE